MKNLPEHEAFKALENRLNNYTEQPDDALWQKVAAALPPSKPALWAPSMNHFAGILAVAALGWALGYRSAQGVEGNALASAQPTSASVAEIKSDGAVQSQIQQGNTDALPQKDQQALPSSTAVTNKNNVHSNQGPRSDAGSGLNSNVNAGRAVNQHSGSPHRMSSDYHSPTEAQPGASEVPGSSPASSFFSTSDKHRQSNLPLGQSTSPVEAKRPDAVGDASGTSSLKPASSLNLLSSSSDPQTIKSANESKSSTALTMGNSHVKQIASDSSQQKVFTLFKADSAAEAPYNRPKKKRADISFYALFSPTLSFQTATPSARDGVVIQKFNKPAILSGNRLGLALEAGVQGRLTKKFEYFAGLSVYRQSQTLQYTYQSAGNAVIDNSTDDLSYTVKPATAERSVSYNMLNVGAQAGVLYTLKEHRLSHKIGVALQYQKGLTHASTGESYDNASSSYLNYQVLYRAEIALADRLTFIVQPSVTRTWLVNETLHVPFALKQYRPGVSIGLSYRFKR